MRNEALIADPPRYSYEEYLRRKSLKLERIVMPIVRQEQILKSFTGSLRTAIISPYNEMGVASGIIFGSYARKDPITGPTDDSDMDLILHKSGFLRTYEVIRFIELVYHYLDHSYLKKLGFNKGKIQVEIQVNDSGLALIKQGVYPYTMNDYILVQGRSSK